MNKNRNYQHLHPLAHKLVGEKIDGYPLKITESNILWRSNKPLAEIESILHQITQSVVEKCNILGVKHIQVQLMIAQNLLSNKNTTTVKHPLSSFVCKDYQPTFYTIRKPLILNEALLMQCSLPKNSRIHALDFKIALKILFSRNNPFIKHSIQTRGSIRAKNLARRAKMFSQGIESKQEARKLAPLRFYAISRYDNEVRAHIFKVQNKDWIEEYKKSIQPVVCGNFYICPSWHKEHIYQERQKDLCGIDKKFKGNGQVDRTKTNLRTIIIDPSLSFGSGHHASTAMCIEFLSALDLEGKNMLDVGCGSGILSLVGASLGAKIYACDTDSYACLQTQQNFSNNHLRYEAIWQGSLEVLHRDSHKKLHSVFQMPINTKDGGKDSETMHNTIGFQSQNDKMLIQDSKIALPLEYECICANITSSVLILLKQQLIKYLKHRGTLILSGILNGHEKRMMANFSTLQLIEKRQIDEWIALKFIKK